MTERITKLDNGLTVATDRVHGARSVAIGVWVGVGSRDEPPEQSGVSHFLEHLLFKGTPTRTATDISRSVDRVGGDINAFTAKEYTSFYCRMPARHGGAGIELLGDVLARSTLDDDDVESERQVILEELAMDDDSPDDVALRTLTRQLFPDHGLGRDTAGDRDTVRSITADDIRRFPSRPLHHRLDGRRRRRRDRPRRHPRCRRRRLRRSPDGDGRVPRLGPGGVGDSFAIDDDSEQVHLAIGGRSVRRDDPDREVLDVVNHVFGGGLSSRLFDEIRERRGLAYSVYSATSSFADTGAWSVYAGSMPEHAGEVERLIHGEIERLVSGGITAEELDVAVGYLTGAYQLGLEDTAARMSRLGGMLITLGKVHSVEEQLARWEQVTLDDAKRVIADVFGAAPPVTVTVGPSF